MRCLLLGGTGAVGQAVCRRLAAEGAAVAFTYHRSSALAEALAAETKSRALPLDLRDAAAVDAAVDAAAASLSGLDALVVCSGVAAPMEPAGPGSKHTMALAGAEEIDAVFAVNVRGPYLACRRAAPHLAAAGGGGIVFMASIDAAKPMPSPVHFAASQAALRGLAQALAKELGPQKIRVNTVAAGLLDAGIARHVGKDARADYERHAGLRRLGRPSEIAAAVVHLALHDTYVTGQTVLVDGSI
jgi:NAD(P)-dependent dehydrogenase (short-subunit alcohol dehydrogenase family)